MLVMGRFQSTRLHCGQAEDKPVLGEAWGWCVDFLDTMSICTHKGVTRPLVDRLMG